MVIVGFIYMWVAYTAYGKNSGKYYFFEVYHYVGLSYRYFFEAV